MLLGPLLPMPVQAASPVISDVQAVGITEDTAIITWATDIDATGNVEYGNVSGGPYSSTAPSPEDSSADNTSHAVLLLGLQTNTTYYFRVKSSDRAGPDVVSAEYSFKTRAFTITSVAASSITDSSATITWDTSVAATSNVDYGEDTSYGSIAPVPEDSSADNTHHVVVLSGLSASTTYHYRVRCQNAEGDEELSVDKTFTTAADATSPTISDVVSSDETSTSATINWNTSEPATSQVAYDTSSHSDPGWTSIAQLTAAYGANSPKDSDLVTSHGIMLGGLLSNTTYYYRVMSEDSSGNEAWSDEGTFTTEADATAPVISNVTATDISDTEATITWDTDEAATSQVEYGTTSASHGDYDTTTAEDASLVTSHMLVITGLTPGTTYYYRAISRDSAVPANEAVSGEASFTTEADTTAPVISNIAFSNVTSDSAIVTWSTNEPADSQVEYGLDTGYGTTTPLDTVLVTNHAVSLTGLATDTTYHLRVISSDAAGNSAVSEDQTLTTAADTTPPVITVLPASGVTETTATINWNTNEPATSQVEYGPTVAYGSTTPLDTSLVTNHSVVITGLTPGTTYHYRVISRDAATPTPNQAESEDHEFTTSVDATPPPAPTLLSPDDGLVDSNVTPAFDWSDVWDASGVSYDFQLAEDAAFSSPLVDRSGLEYSSFSLTDALSDGTYYWRVQAVDLSPASNASGWSGPWSFTVDTTGPTVELTPFSPDPTSDNTPTLEGTATDASSAVVAVEYRVDGGTWTEAQATDGAFDSLSEGFTFTTPELADGAHTVEVRAQDDLGNWTATAEYAADEFTVDTTPPVVTIDNLPYHPATPLTTPTFTGTVADATTAIAAVEYRVLSADGTAVEIDWTAADFTVGPGDPSTASYTFTTTALTDGWHLLEVRALDAAGNCGTAEYNPSLGFQVTTKPLARFDPNEPITATDPMWVTEDNRTRDNTPTFKGDAVSSLKAVVGVQCSIDGGDWVEATFTQNPDDPTTGTWEFTPDPVADGAHFIQVKAIDEVGDETPAEVYAEGGAAYLAFTIDTTPPVISNVTISDITPDSAVITWTTDEPAYGQLQYGTDTEYGSFTDPDPTLKTEHSVRLTGLSFKTEYHFRVKATDDVGNETLSEDYTFSTPLPVWIYVVAAVGGLIALAVVLSIAVTVFRRMTGPR